MIDACLYLLVSAVHIGWGEAHQNLHLYFRLASCFRFNSYFIFICDLVSCNPLIYPFQLCGFLHWWYIRESLHMSPQASDDEVTHVIHFHLFTNFTWYIYVINSWVHLWDTVRDFHSSQDKSQVGYKNIFFEQLCLLASWWSTNNPQAKALRLRFWWLKK